MLRVEAPGQHLSDFTPRPRPQAGALGAAGTEGAGGAQDIASRVSPSMGRASDRGENLRVQQTSNVS